jgi:hypothetical protein
MSLIVAALAQYHTPFRQGAIPTAIP